MIKKQKRRMIIYPIIGVILIHLVFSYSNWAFSPGKWENGSAALAGFFHFVIIALGIAVGYNQED